ncbi:N-acetyltransferase 6 [Pelobates cultripes]|uniref:N-acetyltransferase 6 n=1 Tax=Pelobates cultripes TaxID=61616 RepID=A0AAD1T0Z2_PELCU|nr:N-acetyltransferase 6 [Pelobates cultripes]
MGDHPGTGVHLPSNLVLVPLHLRQDLIASCAELLNQTWRRSLGARIHSLERSCDEFPVCLVLIRECGGPVLGHVRLCRVIGLKDSLFVESVVVSEELRGKGYGRKLMEATEHYARRRGFQKMHLTTHDKQYFYSHLGYQLSEPVQNMGTLGGLLPSGIFQSMTWTDSTSAKLPAPPSHSHFTSPALPVSPPNPLASNLPPPPLPVNLSASTLSSQLPPLNVLSAPQPAHHSSDPLPTVGPSPQAPPAPPPLPSPPSYLANTQCPFSSEPVNSTACSTNPPPPPPLPLSFPSTNLPASPLSSPSGPPLFPPSPKSTECAETGQTLQSPYKDFRGQTIFWMKKCI